VSRRLAEVPGAAVEHNKFCVSAHFRNCAAENWQRVVGAVDDTVRGRQELRVTRGRKVLEVRPKVSCGVSQPARPGASMVHGTSVVVSVASLGGTACRGC
jgi:hypothetical protein